MFLRRIVDGEATHSIVERSDQFVLAGKYIKSEERTGMTMCRARWEQTQVIRKSALTYFALVLGVTAFLGCSTPLTTREEGAGIGTLGGAVAGGIIGSAVGHAGAGAAIGGLLGPGAGALIGDQLQGHEMKQNDQQQRIDQEQREIDRQRSERRILV